MIIETSANQFYRVTETGFAGLDHCWYGYSVKRVRGEFVLTALGKRAFSLNRPELVRKAATRVVVTFNEDVQREHGKRVAERARVNGQPNGYRPISESELRRNAPRNALRNAVNRAIANGSPIFENQE
jgi:hypothetical protein